MTNGAFFRSRWLSLPLLLVALLSLCASRAGAFEVGDRVDVKRGLEWARGTIVGLDEARGRYTVKLDDDGTLGNLSAEQKEKRLTRNYFPSQLRAVRGEDSPPPVTSPPAATEPTGPMVSIPPVAAGGGSERRTWSDKSGRFKIDATYRGMNGEKVILEKTDGTRIEVELAKLSDADNQYVNSQVASAENPFDVPALAGGPMTPGTLPSGAPSHDGMKAIEPRTFSSWTFKPTPNAVSPGTGKSQRIALAKLPDSNKFFEDIQAVSVSNDGKRALVQRQEGDVGGDQLYVDQVDLESGRSLGAAPLPRKREIVALSAQFNMVVWKTDTFSDNPNHLGVGRFEQGRLVPLGEFEPVFPGSEPDDPFGRFRHVWVVGPQHVMVGGAEEMLVVWDVVARRAVWQIPVSRMFRESNIAISSDGHYIAIDMEKQVALIDLQAGQHVATVTKEGGQGSHVWGLSLSDDCTRLAVQGFSDVSVYDLTSGKQLYQFRHKTLFPGDSLAFLGDFLFHRGTYIYDPYHRVLLWELKGTAWHDEGTAIGGGIVATATNHRNDKGPIYLETAPLPMQQMVELAGSLGDPESLVICRAGDKIAIDLDIDPAVASEDYVYSELVKNLESAELQVVADDVPLVITGYCKPRPPETIRVSTRAFGHFGRSEDIVERTITPHPSYLSVTYQGIEVWRVGNSGEPGAIFRLNEGESVDQALTRLTTPNIDILTKTKLSLPLIRPGKATPNGAYGTSSVGGGKGGSGGKFE